MTRAFRTYSGGLSVIDRFPSPVYFRYMVDGSSDVRVGFIAQEVRSVLPEAVSASDILTIDYIVIIATLVNAVRELEQRINELEKKR